MDSQLQIPTAMASQLLLTYTTTRPSLGLITGVYNRPIVPSPTPQWVSPLRNAAIPESTAQVITIYDTVTVSVTSVETRTQTVFDNVLDLRSNIALEATATSTSARSVLSTSIPTTPVPELPLPIPLSTPLPLPLPALPISLNLPIPLILSPTPSTSSSSSASPTPSTRPEKAWSAPISIEDLSSFGITKFYGNVHNVDLVEGIPASASALPRPRPTFDPNSPSYLQSPSLDDGNDDEDTIPIIPWTNIWTNTTKVLQIFFPAHSANPSKKPVGGAQFYANPFSKPPGIQNAKNVTLGYSVFFPKDFDWVLGGKLPGLYGGHEGCSGGDKADTCFSTRLMWRKDGEGELYLYAPRDKQPSYLCADPTSVCNDKYGFSIGRGLFSFALGKWTTVQQTIVLNTPGKQDGTFVLDVNGKRVIKREGVYYRGGNGRKAGGKSGPKKGGEQGGKRPTGGKKSDEDDDDGDSNGLLGGLLGPPQRAFLQQNSVSDLPQVQSFISTGVPVDLASQFKRLMGPNHSVYIAQVVGSGITKTIPSDDVIYLTTAQHPSMIEFSELDPMDNEKDDTQSISKTSHQRHHNRDTDSDDDATITVEARDTDSIEPIGFTGIFFSTFFGGHQPEYATPKDQYVWFKDFSVIENIFN